MICVLQFDAASVAVLQRMEAAGQLPGLAALRERGRTLELETPAVDFAAGAFYTLYSGRELGDHGLFYPFQWSAAEQRARYATAFEAPAPVWELLGRAGMRTLAVDPYESRPPREWREEWGTLVCGVGFRERVVLPRWATSRAAARLAPRGPEATEIFGRPRAAELLALRRKLIAAPGRVVDAALALLREQRYDLVWLTFSAAHVAGHQFWDLSQLGEEPPPDEREVLSHALEDVYRAVDEAIGRVVARLGDDDQVIVTSPVGMDVNTSRADLLPGMLAAVLRGGPLPESDRSDFIWRLRAALPTRLRAAVANAIPDRVALELTARLELGGIDWEKTRAFAHPADNQGYVRFNLRGRERAGILDPGEADALVAEIEAGLHTFHDPDGTPAVAEVVRVPELYPGERSERLPDLSVRWSERPTTRLDYVVSDRFGVVRRAGTGSGRSGNHTLGDAWALLVPGSAELREPSRPPRLSDIAATIAALAGVETSELPGEPLMA